MLVDDTNKVFMIDAEDKEFGLDIYHLLWTIENQHTSRGGYVGWKWIGRKLYIAIQDPTPEAWAGMMNEITKFSAWKHAGLKAYREKLKREEGKPKKKGFDWPFGKR